MFYCMYTCTGTFHVCINHMYNTHACMHTQNSQTSMPTSTSILYMYIHTHTHIHVYIYTHICTWTHKLLYSFYSYNKRHTHTHINLHSISITTLYRLSITHTHTHTQITASLCLLPLNAEHKSKDNLTHFGETCKYLAQRMSLQSQRGSKHWEKRRKRGSKRHREMDQWHTIVTIHIYVMQKYLNFKQYS